MVRAAHLLGGCGAGGEFIRKEGSSICSVGDSGELMDALIVPVKAILTRHMNFCRRARLTGHLYSKQKAPFFSLSWQHLPTSPLFPPTCLRMKASSVLQPYNTDLHHLLLEQSPSQTKDFLYSCGSRVPCYSGCRVLSVLV